MHGPPPSISNFEGDRPPVPPKSPPMHVYVQRTNRGFLVETTKDLFGENGSIPVETVNLIIVETEDLLVETRDMGCIEKMIFTTRPNTNTNN